MLGLDRKSLQIATLSALAVLNAPAAVAQDEASSSSLPTQPLSEATMPPLTDCYHKSDSIIIPATKYTDPVVITVTEADRFAMKFMAPSVILMSIAGLFVAINTLLRKVALMSPGEQANPSHRNDGE
jgi:hypothetical protein